MAKQTQRLGKGLATLIGPRNRNEVPRPSRPQLEAVPAREGVHQVPVDQIVPNPQQPRTHFEQSALEHLAASIRTNGILQPLIVRAAADSDQFELLAGERRWRAAQLARLAHVPVVIREVTDQQALEIALIENLQREDLGPLERATAYQQLIDNFQLTPESVAGRLGESRANVANYLRLLGLSEELRSMIARGELGMGHARSIAGISNPQKQLAVARLAVRRNLSVRQVEQLAREDAPTPPAPRRSATNQHLDEVARELSKALGMQVKLHPGKRKNAGKLVIHYQSLEEFERIAERIGAETRFD